MNFVSCLSGMFRVGYLFRPDLADVVALEFRKSKQSLVYTGGPKRGGNVQAIGVVYYKVEKGSHCPGRITCD